MQYYIMYKKKSSKRFTDAIKLNSKTSLAEIRTALKKSVRPGYKTKIVTRSELLRLGIKP